MILVILFIIAAWLLPLPVALQVLITVFGSISVLWSIAKIVVKCIEAANKV